MLIFFEEVRPCEGRIITTQYDNGRVGFYFIDNTDGWGIVSFSGMKQEQHSPSENLRLLPIDALIIGEVCVPALGSCTFEDPLGSSFKCNTSGPLGIGCCDGQTKQAPQ